MTEPAQARDAEVSLLGAAMSGFPRIDDLLAAVQPEDFYAPLHEQVWAAIGRVHAAGTKPDPVSVRLALDDAEFRHDPAALLGMTALVPLVSNAPLYAAEVAEAAGERALQAAAARLQQIATAPGRLEEKREQARQAVDEACRGRVVSRARTIAELLPDALDAAEQGKGAALDTGWPDLDRLIGLAPGRLVVFAARPGGGKSISGTNLALHFAHNHRHAVLLCSLEMPQSEVMNRLLAAHAGVNLTSLENATVDEASWQRLAERHGELSEMPIYVDDSSTLTPQGVRRLARDVQRHRDDLALIVVDYLQLLSPVEQRKNGTRAEEVSGISRELKRIARETGACVVAMAQVNREGATHDGPRLTDLREGGIENDADVVVLMHRADPEVPEVAVNVAKNRHGPLGQCVLQMQGHYARLASVAWSPRGTA